MQVRLTPAHLGEQGTDWGSLEELRDDHKRLELTMRGQGCLQLAPGHVRGSVRGQGCMQGGLEWASIERWWSAQGLAYRKEGRRSGG